MPTGTESQDAVLRSALPKTTGQAKFVSDISIPGTLHGHVVRSPYAHARIRHIDVAAARQSPGVAAVVTAAEVPGINRLGKTRFDQPILADVKLRTHLDAVALVAAEDEEAAQDAARKIDLEVDPLPAVFTVDEALAPGASLVHEDCPGNELKHIELSKGDVSEGFKQADLELEQEYETPAIEHAYFEPDNGLMEPHADGTYTLWVGCHSVYTERTIAATTLHVPEDNILVIQPYTGGSFGGKDDGLLTAYLSLLAHSSRRPVRITLTRQEEFVAHTKRHPQWIHLRMGLRKDGTITAVQFKIRTDTGAYAHWGEGIFTFASIGACGPYRVPNQKVSTQVVYTNNIPMGAIRAWGMPAVTFAMESHLDAAAHLLSMHPLQLRWINAAADGDTMITGSPFPAGVRIRQVIAAAAKAAGVPLSGMGETG